MLLLKHAYYPIALLFLLVFCSYNAAKVAILGISARAVKRLAGPQGNGKKGGLISTKNDLIFDKDYISYFSRAL